MEDKRETSNQPAPQTNVINQVPSTQQPVLVDDESVAKEKNVFRTYYLVYYIMGLLEILLAFRFVFMLLGANPTSSFVSFMYSLTGIFVAPFSGIFPTAASQTVQTASVFDPAILIAMAVYAIIGWGIAKLFHVLVTGRVPSA